MDKSAQLLNSQIVRCHSVLNPVYVLCIANYCRKHESETPGKLLFSYQFREEETNELFGNQLGIYVLEVPRVEEIWSAAETDMERWCCLFQNLSIFANVPEDAAGFDEVFAVSRVDELSETQIKDYKDAMLSEYEKRVIKEYAYKTGHEEGRAEGIAEGMSKGAEQMRESIKARLEKLGLSQELIDEALKA